MQHIARSKITDFISYIEIYSAFFSFFNNKWGNFARLIILYCTTEYIINDTQKYLHTQFQEHT